jgi:quercetin dioxygenase-like cupin family protein
MTVTLTSVELATVSGDGGVVWSCSPGGFHANLVVLTGDQAIAPHENAALDVLILVVDGTAEITVDDAVHRLEAGSALLVPRGSTRSIAAVGGGTRYLTVHGERPPLGIERRA